MRLTKFDWILLIFATVFIIFGIVTWITFPFIYKREVESNLQFKQHVDCTLSKSAWQWSHPPMVNVMSFYFFNVTNPDEILYEGAKPAVVEVGPWIFQEKEEKKYMKWSDDKTEVFYENYKSYYARPDLCNDCNFDDKVTIPNPVALGAAADIFDPQYNITNSTRQIIAYGMLLMGEFPFITQSVNDILFNGYPDALLSIAHSKFLAVVELMFNDGKSIIPIPIPDMPRMGFFQGYNNTQDAWYWIKTGKEDINNLGEVVTWGNQSFLPDSWWTDEYARSIRGTDSGSFSKMNLQKDDVIPMFQSFFCRSFDAVYLNDSVFHNIPSYTYSVEYDQWDTTANENVGFRYRNAEQVNYYLTWPSCPDRASMLCSGETVNCALQENLCHNCCQGSFVNGTFLLPPGIYPLVCYPGKLELSPFSVMFSPPHFAFSPKEVTDSIYGIAPNLEEHRPLLYLREPYSGTVINAVVQLMVSIPVFPNKAVYQFMDMPSTIIPIFWQSARAVLTDDTYNLIWFGFVFVPLFVDILKYSLICFGLFLIVLVAFRSLRRKELVKEIY